MTEKFFAAQRSTVRSRSMAKRSHPVEVVRVTAGLAAPLARDVVAVEEPLEIRVAGETFAVTMRTPGDDRELAIGLLFSEGLIASVDDLSAIAHCARADDLAQGNVLEVTPAPGVFIDLDARAPSRRGTLTTSACGVCGRRTVDDLLATRAPLPLGAGVDARVISQCVRSLRERQRLFDETGGCHGAALFTFEGAHVATFEDIGRHNAVDKTVGAMVRAKRVPLAEHMLVVSGRAGFEVVQKAHAGGVPVVVSVSAPSSLAVAMADRANITLAGFARGESLTLYTSPERVRVG